MNISRKNSKAGTVLSVEGELTIYTVTQAKQSLLEGHENFTSSVVLDLKNVSEIDTAGLQLLLFVQKHFNSLGKKLQVIKSNEQVDAILAQLDVANYFVLEN
jgi:anti-sigma B factor antagonist